MAYLRELTKLCIHSGCTRPAKVVLINRSNGSNGEFCPRHGRQALAKELEFEHQLELERAEKAAKKAGGA